MKSVLLTIITMVFALVLCYPLADFAQNPDTGPGTGKVGSEKPDAEPAKTESTQPLPLESLNPKKVEDPEKSQDPAKPAAPKEGGASYDIKLRGLEERVNELKEKIFRTKARIMQLQETVVTGSIGAGARAILVHRNEMGGAFKLRSAQYALDAQAIFKKVDIEGDLDSMAEKEIFNGNIVPGNHNIAVQMVFQGQGYGFFSYVQGYKFKIKSSYTFTAEEGKIVTVKIVGFERGGFLTALEERPAVRYDIQIEKLTPQKAESLNKQTEEAG